MGRSAPARVAGALLGAAVSATLLVGAPPVSSADPAERKRQVESSIDALRHDLEGTSEELTAAAVALEQTEARLPDAQAELEQAQATVEQARAKDAELAGRLAAAEQSEVKADKALREGVAAIEETQQTLGQIAAEAYRGGSMAPGLAIALSAQSPADFADRYVMVDTALRSQNSALADLNEQRALRAHAEARLTAVREEVDRLRQEAAANLEVARAAEADAAARKQEIEQLRAAQAEALAVVESRRDEELRRLDRLEGERAALEAELRRLEEERQRKEAAERRRRQAAEEERRRAAASRDRGNTARGSVAAPAPPAPRGGGTLSYPVQARISSHYGYRIHPIYKTRRLHGGTDFAAPCGTPVRAAADGTVVRAGVNGGFGNQVVVQHGTMRGSGVATSYNHLQGYAVRSGSVSRGQVVGYVGTTGTSTGCHLHFEVYVNGSTTNPMGWL